MLFYGRIFLHYKKFVNKSCTKFLGHVQTADAHMIGELKKACKFIPFLES